MVRFFNVVQTDRVKPSEAAYLIHLCGHLQGAS